jgi:ech hydrogenase subunit D
MSQEQNIELITVDTLLDKVRAKREQGHRLVQMSATRLPEQVELTYSFDLNSRLTNLRLSLPAVETRLPSISSIYGCAILYENEIHDLFNVKVDGLTVDFHGNFYKTAIKFPFGSTKVACASSAAAPAPGAATASCAPAPAANPGATK